MRTIRNLTIKCGPMEVPVKVGAAVPEQRSQFSLVHAGCGGPIKMPRKCGTCDSPVDEVNKSFQLPDGTRVTLNQEDLAELAVADKTEVVIDRVVDAALVDPMHLDTPYFLAPGSATPTSYRLLARALGDRVATVTVTLRGDRPRRGALRVRHYDGVPVLLLETLRWATAMNQPDFLDKLRTGDDAPNAKEEKELRMTTAILDVMAEPEIGDQIDDYDLRLLAVAAKKAALDAKSSAAGKEDAGVLALLKALDGQLTAEILKQQINGGAPAAPQADAGAQATDVEVGVEAVDLDADGDVMRQIGALQPQRERASVAAGTATEGVETLTARAS